MIVSFDGNIRDAISSLGSVHWCIYCVVMHSKIQCLRAWNLPSLSPFAPSFPSSIYMYIFPLWVVSLFWFPSQSILFFRTCRRIKADFSHRRLSFVGAAIDSDIFSVEDHRVSANHNDGSPSDREILNFPSFQIDLSSICKLDSCLPSSVKQSRKSGLHVEEFFFSFISTFSLCLIQNCGLEKTSEGTERMWGLNYWCPMAQLLIWGLVSEWLRGIDGMYLF